MTTDLRTLVELYDIYSVPRETVFALWGSADMVKAWFAPPGYTVVEAEVEFHIDGRFEACVEGPDGVRQWTRGRFVDVTPPSGLIIDAEVSDESGRPLMSTRTEASFSREGYRTTMTLRQTITALAPAAKPLIDEADAAWQGVLFKFGQAMSALHRAEDNPPRIAVPAQFSVERIYDAPVDRVWHALTDPVAKATWSHPPGNFVVVDQHFDIRVGGTERRMAFWEGQALACLDYSYHDIIEYERIVSSYTVHLNGRRLSASISTIQLEALGKRTRLTQFEVGSFFDGYYYPPLREAGTNVVLDNLADYLKR
ncbi:hypothetical protein BH10PSE12_BH10PSE12_22580 [soil metagenome]